MAKLTEQEIAEKLTALHTWSYKGGMLVRDYAFEDFQQAFAFVTRLALMAEKKDHHPDIDIRYNKVRVALVSHDAGGVTDRDVSMAEAIGNL